MIIFLYGEDYFRSNQKIFEIRKKFLSTDKSGSGLSVFDYEEEKEVFKKIQNSLNISNLLAKKRLVIVKNSILKLSLENQKELSEFLKKKKKLSEDKDVVLIFLEKNMPKKNSHLYKFFLDKKNNIKSQNFEKLSGLKLEAWTLKLIQEVNPETKISKLALSKLMAFCSLDNFLLYNEIQKLVSYVDNGLIEEKDVDLLVKANFGNNVFQMVDALGLNNKKEALKILHKQLEKGDDPFYLLSMFVYQFRNMLKVADLYEQGISSEYEISRITKLHSFVVRKSLSQTRNFSFDKLKEIYQKLSALDVDVKTGHIDIRLALDKFVAEL